MTHAVTIFDSFNARQLDPREVARTFIPPRHYRVLLKRCHTIIVGPRGSGKTTLLKMLQGPALEAWTHPDAARCRAAVDFTGVFVPADRAWGAQVAAIGEGLDPEHRELLGRAAFTTHVLSALVSAMNYRAHGPTQKGLVPHLRVSIAEQAEAEAVSAIAAAWHLAPRAPSLLGLRLALAARLSEIEEIASAERLNGPDGRSTRLAERNCLHLHFLAAARIAIEAFGQIVGEGGGRWAFLFDELELAPRWSLEELVRSLRSIDDRFLFKLSLSPFSDDIGLLKDALSPMEGNDFEAIPLWYAHKEQGYEFCTALLEGMLRARNMEPVEPAQLLGRSEFESLAEPGRRRVSLYGPGSIAHRRFTSLAETDHTFRNYLEAQNIDLSQLEHLDESERAAEVRKITAIVATRSAYRAPDEGGGSDHARIRSRKRPALYQGASSLFAMVEGNPRWFIGIVSSLLQDLTKPTRIPASSQGPAIWRAISRFRALLRTIPGPNLPAGRRSRGILSVLDRVGQYFFERVAVDDFNPDPPGTFIVDSNISDALERSLAEALNAGALVYVPDEQSELILRSLRGKRFRLSYLLAPLYKLPIRLGRDVALGRILVPEREERGPDQNELFEKESV